MSVVPYACISEFRLFAYHRLAELSGLDAIERRNFENASTARPMQAHAHFTVLYFLIDLYSDNCMTAILNELRRES